MKQITLLLMAFMLSISMVMANEPITKADVTTYAKTYASYNAGKITAKEMKAYYDQLVVKAGSFDKLVAAFKSFSPTCEQQCQFNKESCQSYWCAVHGCCSGCDMFEQCAAAYLGCLAGCVS